MKMKDQDYTLNILKMVINTDLEKSISNSMPDLELLESNRDRLVWEMATNIYTRSGHKVELPMIRDLIDARIRKLKGHFAKEQRLREFAQRKAEINTAIDSSRWIFLKICSVICRCTDVSASRVSMSSKLYDLADEHEVSKILMNLEEAFDLKIPPETARELRTVKHVVEFIGNQHMETGVGHGAMMAL